MTSPDPRPLTPRTAAGRALLDYLERIERGSQDTSFPYALGDILDIEKEAERAPREGDGLLGEALAALKMLHSPHFDWGCNERNCSGFAAIKHIEEAPRDYAERARREGLREAEIARLRAIEAAALNVVHDLTPRGFLGDLPLDVWVDAVTALRDALEATRD